MPTRIGSYTTIMDKSPSLVSYATAVSKKEAEGPLGKYFDIINNDALFGQKSWELGEAEMQRLAVQKALDKGGFTPADLQYVFAGDLLNQIIASHYGLRELGVPFIGLYGACSTMSESLILAAMMVEGDFAGNTLAVTSSHFCSAERQFRFPLEYGGQRPPTAQWTATAAGAVVVGKASAPPYVRAVSVGSIDQKDVRDVNNMGAAMAPAAATTLRRYFEDTLTGPGDYDLILTGDLGHVGAELFRELMKRDGYELTKAHGDCGLLLYDRETQDVDAGGSGCGCSAAVLCGFVLPAMRKGKLNDVLFMATGALMSTVSVQQGQNIPGVAHLLHLSHRPA
ncbi:MAG: stage V sporulation protein AD [Oscillospiraceae bacterium]|jgi:stage V sporulation protein AD|nr:stage V sporulation protein AD [Oscillospiraceae bacterium]